MFLLQTVVLIVLLALMASALVSLGFGRYVLVHKANDSLAGRALLAAAENQVQACLWGTSFGKNSCDSSAARDCFPARLEGRTVSINTGGSPPYCSLSIELKE